jgi:hypothetical protein
VNRTLVYRSALNMGVVHARKGRPIADISPPFPPFFLDPSKKGVNATVSFCREHAIDDN